MRSIFALAVSGLLCSSAAAQHVADIVVCETTHDQLFRCTDLDGDGFYLSPGEARVFYTDGFLGTNVSSPRSMEMRLEGGQPVAYWVDTTQDIVFRGEDVNYSGEIELSEGVKFRDIAGVDGFNSSPDGVELTPDGAVWWTSDGTNFGGVFRLFDLNADGDANDAGEQVRYSNSTLTETYETDTGTLSVQLKDLGRTAATGNGIVCYNTGNEEAFFRYEDKNLDGDAADAGERRLWLNATGKDLAAPMNPDFQSGVLRSMVIPNGFYCRLSYLTSQIESGTEVFYLASDSSFSSQFAKNINGEGLNCLIFRAVDLNLDGDVNDAAEVTMWYDGSATQFVVPTLDKIIGMDAAEGTIHLAGLLGSAQSLHSLTDLDGDGDAMDAGEQSWSLFDSTVWGLQYPFYISTNPFTYDIGAIAGGTWSNYFSVTGTACSQYGQLPIISGSGLPQLGTAGFKATVKNALPLQPALLLIGTSTTSWLGLPLPLDLTFFGYAGCTLYQDLALQFLTTSNAQGVAQLPLPLPNDPALAGFKLPLQWATLNFINFPPTSALTQLGEVTLFQ